MSLTKALQQQLVRSSGLQLAQTSLQYWRLGFARTLSIHEMSVEKWEDRHLQGTWCIPENLGDGNRGAVPHGALAGALDEFSTLAIMMSDQTHRPGVSLTMTMEPVKAVHPGDTIRLVGGVTKVGKEIAFADMLAFDANGSAVFRGRQVKYLPMGVAWDLLMKPWLRPLAVAIHERDISNRLSGPGSKGIAPGNFLGEAQVCGIEWESVSDLNGGGHSAGLSIGAQVCNTLMNYHGGAVCLASELFAKHVNPEKDIRMSETHYYRAQQNRASSSLIAKNEKDGSSCTIKFVDPQGRLCASTRILWANGYAV